MNISEVRLRQIIKEEVEMAMSREVKPEIDIDAERMVLEETRLYLLDTYINEELDRVFEQDDEDDEIADYKKAKRQAMFDKIKKGAMAAGVAGLVGGGIQSGVSDIEASQTQASAERQTQNIVAANTDEAQLEDFADQLNNRYRFLWGKGSQIAVSYPGTKGKVTVLPASYSIAVQAFLDKKANIERIEQGEKPILRYGDIDLETLPSLSQIEYQGTMDDNIDKFFDVYSGSDMMDAMALLNAVPELKVVPGTAMEKFIVMVKPGNIDSDYVLPELGMTAKNYYNSQYGDFMGSGEKTALNLPGEEMTVTPEFETELDPELIQKTKERATRLKENKITWKNYKNRKKKLAQSMVV